MVDGIAVVVDVVDVVVGCGRVVVNDVVVRTGTESAKRFEAEAVRELKSVSKFSTDGRGVGGTVDGLYVGSICAGDG